MAKVVKEFYYGSDTTMENHTGIHRGVSSGRYVYSTTDAVHVK